MAEIFDRFIGNPQVDDKAKITKLRQLLVVFSNRWAEERTISCVIEFWLEIPRQVLRIAWLHR